MNHLRKKILIVKMIMTTMIIDYPRKRENTCPTYAFFFYSGQKGDNK